MWGKCLGIKYVKINITEENGTDHLTMPFEGTGDVPDSWWRRQEPGAYRKSSYAFYP